MFTECNICNTEKLTEIYQFSGQAITSICSEKKQDSRIYYCNNCTHVMTEPLEDIREFYSDSYNITSDSEEEDQLMKIVDGKKIYRYTYQADTLIKKLGIDSKSDYKILDFGAAKSSTLRKICEIFPSIRPHVYDVSENYKHFWDKFIPKEAQFIHEIPQKFENGFDVVCSFFMLEHVQDPVGILKKKHSLLKEGGTVYFVIPNLYKNTADLLVLDHINHFSPESLLYMMENIGFTDILIDEETNDGWFVVTAKKRTGASKTEAKAVFQERIQELFSKAKEISVYWDKALQKIINFKADEAFAIYGAGFYGSFIALNINSDLKPTCFIDQNQFLQGKEMHGAKVLSPENLPENTRRILVGINPLMAKMAMDSVSAWKDKNLQFEYLFGT